MSQSPEQPRERPLTPDPPRPPGTPEPPDLDVDPAQFIQHEGADRNEQREGAEVPAHADVNADAAAPEPP